MIADQILCFTFFYSTAYGRRPKFVRAEHTATAEGENCTYGPTLRKYEKSLRFTFIQWSKLYFWCPIWNLNLELTLIKVQDVVFHPSPYSTINTTSNEEIEQQRKLLPPILKQETVKLFWDPVMKCHKDGDNFAGLGKEVF